MCLNPLKIRNPTKRIFPSGGQQLSLTVPCGKCADCVKMKRSEWYYRTYYEVQNTLHNNGYVYYDTLTYSNDNLPHISDFIDTHKYPVSDFSCFCHKHFKDFLKRLRRLINYHYGYNSSFKYFLTSEYGTDERFTHRPHYHIMFFVTCDVPPLEFSKLVSKSWKYGRTDGLPYQSVKYVASHIYGKNVGFGANKSFEVISSVCNYVSKYITKHSTFSGQLEKRINYLRMIGMPECELSILIRNVDMFHRQSQGFGLSYLHNLDERAISLLGDDKIYMRDSNSVITTIPIPMYFKRHLYYVNKMRDDKTRYWELTDKGIEHTINQKLKQIDLRVLNLLENFYNSDIKYYNKLIEFLNGRDISDYVIYELFYKGRMRHGDTIDYAKLISQHGITDFEYNLYDWLSIIRQQFKYNSYIKSYIVEDEHVLVKNDKFTRISLHKTIPLKKFIEKFTFNENSCYLFRDFDKIGDLIADMNKQPNTIKEHTFTYLENLKEKLKIIYGKN